MSIELPSLFERIQNGLTGGFRFEELMHRLLYTEAGQLSFKYEPGPGTRDRGVDGWLNGNYENLTQATALQYKFVTTLFAENGKTRDDVMKSIADAAQNFKGRIYTYVLVAPCILRDGDTERIRVDTSEHFEIEIPFALQIWPAQKIEYLLTRDRLMLNYFYPDKVSHFYSHSRPLDVMGGISPYKDALASGFSRLNLAGSARANCQDTRITNLRPSVTYMFP